MKIQKSNNLFSASMIFVFIGILYGYSISLILTGVAIPNYSDAYMTNNMFSLAPSMSTAILSNITTIVYVNISIYFLLIVLFIKMMLPKAYFWKRNNLKIISSLIGIFILINILITLFLYSSTSMRLPEMELGTIIFIPIVMFLIFYISNFVNKESTSDSKSIKQIFINTVLASLIILAFEYYIGNVLSLVLNSITILGGAGEVTTKGLESFSYLSVLFGALSIGFLGSLLALFIKKDTSSGFYIPILFIVLTVIPGQYFINYTNQLDMDKESLNIAANLKVLDEVPEPIKVLLLNNNKVTNVFTWNVRANNIMGALTQKNQVVDLIPDNLKKLENYIDKNKYTYHTDGAMNALSEIGKIQWDLERYRTASLNNIYKNGSVLNSIILLISSESIPVTEKNHKFLETLSNEEVFRIKGSSALLLSKSWISFNDLKRAKHFYEKVESKNKSEDDDTFDKLVKNHSFNKGVISGKIQGVSKNSKIAVISAKRNKDFNLKNTESFYNIKAIKYLNKDSTFSFENLVTGNYALAILLDNSKVKIVKIDGARSFNISKDNAIHNNINIVIQSQ